MVSSSSSMISRNSNPCYTRSMLSPVLNASWTSSNLEDKHLQVAVYGPFVSLFNLCVFAWLGIYQDLPTKVLLEKSRLTDGLCLDCDESNLNESIDSLHGGDSLQEIRLLERKRITLSRGIERLSFLKRCRTGGIIPTFAQIKHNLRNKHTDIFSHASMDLIRKEIKQARKQLDILSRECVNLHLKLAGTIRHDLWMRFPACLSAKVIKICKEMKSKHDKKYTNLTQK